MPLQACTVEAKYMFSLCPLSDCLGILMTCANMDSSARQMGQASPLHKCCGRSITWLQAVFSSLVSALLCICLCVMLALWFAIAAPVAGVSSSDDLVTFTAPEITLPVSISHNCWATFLSLSCNIFFFWYCWTVVNNFCRGWCNNTFHYGIDVCIMYDDILLYAMSGKITRPTVFCT